MERVFLRIGSAETDEQLEGVLGKFLAPVLLKLNSSEETVRKKVNILSYQQITYSVLCVRYFCSQFLALFTSKTPSDFRHFLRTDVRFKYLCKNVVNVDICICGGLEYRTLEKELLCCGLQNLEENSLCI